MKPNFLFVCGRNKWRSPTAVSIYKNDQRLNVRSAGMSDKSSHQISEKDIIWADLIIVMENNYKSWILEKYRDLQLPTIKNLDIPDNYKYNDPELIELIKKGVEYHIQQFEYK